MCICTILHLYAMSVIIAQEVNQMNSDKFEKAFNDFLERKEYDEAENALFTLCAPLLQLFGSPRSAEPAETASFI